MLIDSKKLDGIVDIWLFQCKSSPSDSSPGSDRTPAMILLVLIIHCRKAAWQVVFTCFDSRTFPFGATADPSLPDTENLKENTVKALSWVLLGDATMWSKVICWEPSTGKRLNCCRRFMAFNDLACGHLYLASLSLKVLFGHQGYISSKSQWKGTLPAVSCQYPKKSQW